MMRSARQEIKNGVRATATVFRRLFSKEMFWRDVLVVKEGL